MLCLHRADRLRQKRMRFTYLRGLTRNLGWVRLKFVAMDLKKYVIHKQHICTDFIFCHFSRLFSFAA